MLRVKEELQPALSDLRRCAARLRSLPEGGADLRPVLDSLVLTEARMAATVEHKLRSQLIQLGTPSSAALPVTVEAQARPSPGRETGTLRDCEVCAIHNSNPLDY
mmetsp:Transcript_63345/g.136219  ORF Transcript_63345/g.136219 Transcript_63345/m.136219 type:complete len:105 (-) Transcript_63345:8-322(-)